MFKRLGQAWMTTGSLRLAGSVRLLLGLILAAICLASPGTRAQSAADRWVILATRAVDVRAGHAVIDLSKARGSFKAVRVSVRGGGMELTRVEIKYHGGAVRSGNRALLLRHNRGPRLLDSRSDEQFVDSLALSFREVAGEPDRLVLRVEGLQSPSGAGAVRDEPKASIASKENKGAPKAREFKRDQPLVIQKSERPPPVVAVPPSQAPPAPSVTSPRVEVAPRSIPSAPGSPDGAPAPTTRGGSATAPTAEPWDVVPVFYGTDRNRALEATRVVYGSDRAKRLELGRALVTIPKLHQVPNIERPWVYRLPFTQIVLYSEEEDPKRHFTLKEVRPLSKEEFLRVVRERLGASSSYKNHALVFVHGFNTSFEHALYRTAQIAYDIKFDGAPFLYSWPSKGALSTSDYSYDRESSGAAEPYLRQFLDIVARETGATSVSIIAHSMGSQLLLPVLRDLKYGPPPGIAISQVILAAPDVDRDAFENIAAEIRGVSRGVTMLAASNDRALEISRRFWGGVPRAGDVPTGGPIVTEGVDTIDVTAVSTLLFALNHSGYAERSALLSDIQQLIQTGVRPPDKRVPTLESVATARGQYWRYPKQ